MFLGGREGGVGTSRSKGKRGLVGALCDVTRNGHVSLYLKLAVPSDPQLLSVVRSAVHQLAAVIGFSDEECRSITVAVDEAVTNIIRHAYQNRHDQAIDLVCRQHDDRVEFVLLDRGQAADPEELRGRPLSEVRPGGLGTHIIRQVMDQVDYEPLPDGNRLRLVKYLKKNPAGGE